MPAWLDRLRDALAPLGIAVEREIASGGMGHVAYGRDAALDRPLAIKMLRPEMASAVGEARFLREARSTAGIRHPNVVQVHQAGEQDGVFYYTMDYVEGETLAQRLERGPLPPAEVLRLARDLLAALEATHVRGLVHRDVKPSNIFVTPDRYLLGDFGIAFDSGPSDTTLTRTRDQKGTPAYMPKEQWTGGPVTPATDIYPAGMVLYEAVTGRRWRALLDPARADWQRVPRALEAPLRRALEVEPEDRWQTAAALAAALPPADDAASPPAAVTPASPRRALAAAAMAAAIFVAAIAARSWWPGGGGKGELRPDLAIVPLATTLADSTIGTRLAGYAGSALERVTDLRLAPQLRVLRLNRGLKLPDDQRLARIMRDTGSRHGAWGLLLPSGPRLIARVRLESADGTPLPEIQVTGDTVDLSSFGDSIAYAITRVLYSDRRGHGSSYLARFPLPAQSEFLLGEEAFARDAWLTAERHYLRALRHDSTLVLAAWRLGNARRWMPLRSGPPYPASLLPQFLAQRDSVPGTDRLLIEAQFEPTGRARLDRYEDALKLARDDPYPALLYGDELFHRGPLAGRPLDDAVRMLERATAADSTLAPGWEHLAWALIRRGERDRAAVALEHLGHWAGGEEETEIPVPLFLGIAWQFRFQGPGQRAAMEGLARDTARLALAARGAMSFDLPDAQAMLAQALVARAGTASLRGSGYVAEGVARYALGQPGAALAAFDSAAHQFSPAGEARLQAAEWRVVPAALGVPGPGAAERERGRRRLEEMLEDPALGVRAAWALALDAYRRGDTLAGARFAAIVTRAPTATARRLAPSLEGVRGAAAGRLEDALESSAPALAWDSAGLAPDPFLRATLHLLRGEWLESLGRADEADRSWLWYENLDVRGWPSAEAQPAEVDWALSTEARARRARLARERGQASRACALASRALQLWARAEPVLDGARHDLERLARECPR